MKQTETNWTWDKIKKEQARMTDAELDRAISSLMPENIRQITRKLDDGLELTEAEELKLEAWENSPQSGPAGSIMGGR